MTPYDERSLCLVTRASLFRYVIFHPCLSSTNIEAYRLAMEGAPEGTVVIADEQTAGRGRLNRTWRSPRGVNFYGSFILRPPIPPDRAPQLTLVAGLAVAELLSLYRPGHVTIKWPNDILIDGRKLCGILTEMRARGEVEFVIVGIGININMKREDFPEDIRETATSLRDVCGVDIDRVEMVGKLVDNLEKWYRVFTRDGFRAIRDPWNVYAGLTGKVIRVIYKDEVETGTALGLDEKGHIVMRDGAGVIRHITAGDVYVEP